MPNFKVCRVLKRLRPPRSLVAGVHAQLESERRDVPPGISVVAVMRCVAQAATAAGAHKLARFAYGRLQGYRIPPAWQARHTRHATLPLDTAQFDVLYTICIIMLYGWLKQSRQ